VPFTARLPRLTLDSWQPIDLALASLEAVMEVAPCNIGRIETDAAYVERLAVVLKEAGDAIATAHLKNEVIDAGSWLTESRAESWVRALLQLGFDKALTSEALAAWLGQTNQEGERPGGDPAFFALMRSSLSDFAKALRDKTRPEHSPVPYDPRQAQPQTLGQLEHWLRASEVSKRASMVAPPVSLNQPPNWPAIPGLEQLTAYCNAHFGTPLSHDAIIRIRGAYCLASGMGPAAADATPLSVVADILVPQPRTRTLLPEERSRVKEHAFLQRLRDTEQRKDEARAAAEKRQQLLEPLYAAVRQVDDTFSKVQGPQKPSKETCDEVAAALFGDLEALRAALMAAGKEGSLEALRREATDPNERQWLLDALRGKTPAAEISKVLLLGDRSHLYYAWQNLASDLVNWQPGKVAEVAPAVRQPTGSPTADPAPGDKPRKADVAVKEPTTGQAAGDQMRKATRASGGKEIETIELQDHDFMKLAIDEARKSVGEDDRAHPKVGVVVVKKGRILATAHRGELGQGEHAEYTALEKKLADEMISGATVYATLEPCTSRNHPKIPCANRLIERKVERVIIGMLDPNPAICGRGERLLRNHGIVVERFPHELILELEELNRDFVRAQSQVASPGAEQRQIQDAGAATPLSSETLDRGLLDPCLRVEFGEGDNFLFQTPYEVLDNGYVVRWSCYVRLRVVNVGRKAAKNCRGYLTQVEWKNDNGIFEPAPYYDSLPFIWSYKGREQGNPAVDLLQGVEHYLDILATFSFPSREPPWDPKHDSERFELQTQFLPLRYSNLFSGTRTYRFTIKVSAEDVEPRILRLVFKWNGKWDDFEVWEFGDDHREPP
jgi:pyrimidine deaminase RibD-like protein